MDFLKDFEKTVGKDEGIMGASEPPRYWYSSGNYVLNKIMSDSYDGCIPQGRITGLVGPSGSGKSFLAANFIVDAQKRGDWILVVDSENALDDDFMGKIGVDVTDKYVYKSVTTIPQAIKVISTFIKGYAAEYGSRDDAPRVLIVLDSLDMLSTESELEHFQKGENSSDQGLRAKQLKQMLRQFVQAIKGKNIAMVVTGQVYQATAQQLLAGEGKWIVNAAIRYALSQIILLTRLKLKDANKDVTGIRMSAEGFKNRFALPFQSVEIYVPYETGIDPISGLLETAVAQNVVLKRGSRYVLASDGDTAPTWYEKDMAPLVPRILEDLKQAGGNWRTKFDEKEIDMAGEGASATSERRARATAETE